MNRGGGWLAAGWRGHLLAALAGGLQTLSLAPFHLWPLGILAAGLLFSCLRALSPAQVFTRGFCYGLGLFASGISWVFVSIHFHGNASVFTAAAVTFLLCCFLSLLKALPLWGWSFLNLRPAAKGLLGFPAAWLLGEWLSLWALTGFPWLLAGYAHLHTPLAGWAPVGGVLWVGALVAFTGVAAAELLTGARRTRPALLLCGVWLAGAALAQADWTAPTGKSLRVAVLQPNIQLKEKFSPRGRFITRNTYRERSALLWDNHDLLVWPETALPAGYPENKSFLDELSATALESDSALVTGIAERVQTGGEVRYYNTALAVGYGRGRYRKRHLVPIGEFVPVKNLLRRLSPLFDLPLSSFARGAREQPPLRVKGQALDTFICYEIAYPGLVAGSLGPAGALLTISEDAWFGDSPAPWQHLQIAQMRALENGRELVRGTNTGISAFVDHRGKIKQRAELMRDAVLSDELGLRRGRTPFSRARHWPAVLIALGVFAGGLGRRKAAARG